MNNIVMQKTADLIPYINNARTHGEVQIAQIAASIREFGFVNPILTDGARGVIAGHGRLLAAKKLGMEEVPTIELSHLSAAQKKAYILADNRIALNSGWDAELLAVEIEALKEVDFDIELLGFDIAEMQANELQEGLTDPDEVPDVNTEAVSKPGDIWIMGNHRLMCGDSTDIVNVEALTCHRDYDMIFTDPMYDDDTQPIIDALNSIKTNNVLLMCTCKQLISFASRSGWSFCFDMILNQKIPSSMQNKKVPYYLHKNIVYFIKEGKETIFNCDNAIGVFSDNGYVPSIIESAKQTRVGHGLAKNVDGIIKILAGFNAKSVVDLFLGSGSTLIACEMTGRACTGMETDPIYCDLIVKRWEDFTGKKATLLNGNVAQF